MGFVAAADPASKVPRIFNDQASLTYAMEKLRFVPLRPDGTPFIVNFLTDEGGYLFDGAPLNVWFDGVWYEGQKEVGQKYWGNNGVPTPSSQVMNIPVVPMPADIAATYQAFKEGQGAGALLSNPWVLLAGGIGLVWLLSGGGKASRSYDTDADDYGE
jgi:hypothetical protein